jgi:hypothetical protein
VHHPFIPLGSLVPYESVADVFSIFFVISYPFDTILENTGSFKDAWGSNTTVPDLTQLEARMWFFFAGSSYIEQGTDLTLTLTLTLTPSVWWQISWL